MSKTYSEDQITDFHRDLYRGCNLTPLSLGMADKSAWWAFLAQMQPLAETEGGPFTRADLTATLAHMQKLVRKGTPFAMRPSTILRDPERFRDMVLEARRDLALASRHRAPQPTRRQPIGHQGSRIVELEDASTVSQADAAATLAELRRKAGLSK